MKSMARRAEAPINTNFMRLAVCEAWKGMNGNEGGPFGAAVVLKGRVISRAHNEVLKSKDPTAHAEILAIRRASKKLGRFELSDCIIYTTCEPCPMCLAAIHWAHIKTFYFGCTKEDAARIRFDDSAIYRAIKGDAEAPQIIGIPMQREECLELFEAWEAKKDKTPY
jgi:guanine deaminase